MKEETIYEYKQRELREKNAEIQLSIDAEEMKQLWKEGKLNNVTPLWHTDKKSIKKDDMKEYLKPNLENELIHWYEIDFLLKMMKNDDEKCLCNVDIFKEKILFHPRLYTIKIYKVINFWGKGQKLLPPTLIYLGGSNTFGIDDGRHRFNTAYCFGATKIPIKMNKNVFYMLNNYL